METIKNWRNNNNGFTLAELLIVVAIIAVLVAVSIPMFVHKLSTTKENVCLSNRKTLIRQIQYQISIGETFDTDDFEQLQKDAEAYCPADGEYKPYIDELTIKITCSVHGDIRGGAADPERTTSQGLLIDYMKAVKDTLQKHGWVSNDVARKDFYEQCGNKWPTLEVEGVEYTIQPFYKEGDKDTTDDRVWLFASPNFDPTLDTKNWNARYVFNTKDGKWYMATNSKGAPTVTSVTRYKDLDALDDDIKNGTNPKWVELKDYKEKGL